MHTTEELLASSSTTLGVPSSRSEEWKDDSQPTLASMDHRIFY